MPILKNNKQELFAHPDYNCARWRHRHGKPGRLGFDRSFTSGHWPSVIDDKFCANLAARMDEGELNTIASELLEGIRCDDESRREHLESEGFMLLGLVIETATTTSVSSSAPVEGMSTVRHPLLLEACSLFQANAVGEMLPAAGPVKVRDDRSQKPNGADMMGHNDGPALDGTRSPLRRRRKRRHKLRRESPPPARRRRSRRQSPASSRCRRDGPSATADCPACPGDGSACRSWPYARCWAGRLLALPMPATPVIPEEQERDAIEDALEKDMNHYLIFLANAPISAAAAMTISLLQSGLTVPDARTPIEDTWAMGSS